MSAFKEVASTGNLSVSAMERGYNPLSTPVRAGCKALGYFVLVLWLPFISGCPTCGEIPSLTVDGFDSGLVGAWEGGSSELQKIPSYGFPATINFRDDQTFSLRVSTDSGQQLVTGNWSVDTESLPEMRIDLAVGCSDFELYPASSLLRGIYRLRKNSESIPEHVTLKLALDPEPVPDGFEIGDFNWTFLNPALLE